MTFIVVRQSALDFLRLECANAMRKIGDARKLLSDSAPAGTIDSARILMAEAVMIVDAIKTAETGMKVAEAVCNECGETESLTVGGTLEAVQSRTLTGKACFALRCYSCRAAIEAEEKAGTEVVR